MADGVSVSGLTTQPGNLTETERILVIALLAVLSILIVCLVTLIAIICRKHMKSESGSYHRSITRSISNRPVLTGTKPRLSVSRLNSRYSGADFSPTPEPHPSRPVSSNPLYFRNKIFQEDYPEASINGDVIDNDVYTSPRNSDVIDNEAAAFYRSPRNSPSPQAKFYLNR